MRSFAATLGLLAIQPFQEVIEAIRHAFLDHFVVHRPQLLTDLDGRLAGQSAAGGRSSYSGTFHGFFRLVVAMRHLETPATREMGRFPLIIHGLTPSGI